LGGTYIHSPNSCSGALSHGAGSSLISSSAELKSRRSAVDRPPVVALHNLLLRVDALRLRVVRLAQLRQVDERGRLLALGMFSTTTWREDSTMGQTRSPSSTAIACWMGTCLAPRRALAMRTVRLRTAMPGCMRSIARRRRQSSASFSGLVAAEA